MRCIPDYGGLFMQKVWRTEPISLTNPERLIPGGFLYMYTVNETARAIEARPSCWAVEGDLTWLQ